MITPLSSLIRHVFVSVAMLCWMLAIAVQPLGANQTYSQPYSPSYDSQWQTSMRFVQRLSLKGNESVLDIGSGNGQITASVSASVPQGSVIGIDILPGMVSQAKRSYVPNAYNNLFFELVDAQSLDFACEFDLILCLMALHYVPDQDAVISGVWKSLKPGGIFAFMVPCSVSPELERAAREVAMRAGWQNCFPNGSTVWQFCNLRGYSQLLESHNFALRRLEVIHQKEKMSSRASLKSFVSQWLPHHEGFLPREREAFIEQVVDRYLQLSPADAQGNIQIEYDRLEIEAMRELEYLQLVSST